MKHIVFVITSLILMRFAHAQEATAASVGLSSAAVDVATFYELNDEAAKLWDDFLKPYNWREQNGVIRELLYGPRPVAPQFIEFHSRVREFLQSSSVDLFKDRNLNLRQIKESFDRPMHMFMRLVLLNIGVVSVQLTEEQSFMGHFYNTEEVGTFRTLIHCLSVVGSCNYEKWAAQAPSRIVRQAREVVLAALYLSAPPVEDVIDCDLVYVMFHDFFYYLPGKRDQLGKILNLEDMGAQTLSSIGECWNMTARDFDWNRAPSSRAVAKRFVKELK